MIVLRKFQFLTMKKAISILFLIFLSLSIMSLVVRHDVPDEQYIALGKKYPQICHLSDGEATLIKENWVVTAAHVATPLSDEIKKTPDFGDRVDVHNFNAVCPQLIAVIA